jgi:hypothetical protein
VWRECSWISSAIVAGEDGAEDGGPGESVTLRPGPPASGAASALLCVASARPLGELRPAAIVSRPVELDQWAVARPEGARRVHDLEAPVRELEGRAARVPELQARLLDAEQVIGTLPQLRQAMQQTGDQKRSLEQELRDLRARVAAIESSRLWRLTAPVRRVRALIRQGIRVVERVEQVLGGLTERRLLERAEGIVDRLKRRLG